MSLDSWIIPWKEDTSLFSQSSVPVDGWMARSSVGRWMARIRSSLFRIHLRIHVMSLASMVWAVLIDIFYYSLLPPSLSFEMFTFSPVAQSPTSGCNARCILLWYLAVNVFLATNSSFWSKSYLMILWQSSSQSICCWWKLWNSWRQWVSWIRRSHSPRYWSGLKLYLVLRIIATFLLKQWMHTMPNTRSYALFEEQTFIVQYD